MTKARDLADRTAADITAVTAGTGIAVTSGAGPIPTVTNTVATGFDAKGDLIVGTGADTFTKLTVASTANFVLSVDSATTSGLKWAAPSTGKILQIVTGSTTTPTTIASTTYTDTGLSASITPSSTSSTILVLSTATWVSGRQSDSTEGGIRLLRGATAIVTYDRGFGVYQSGGAAQTNAFGVFTNAYVDSPATTSSTTYKTQANVNTTANGHSITFQTNNSAGQMILIEIGA